MENGLWTFLDGNDGLTNYQNALNYPIDIIIDKLGAMWITNPRLGIAKYHEKQTSYFNSVTINGQERLIGAMFDCKEDQYERIWFCAEDGLFIYDPNTVSVEEDINTFDDVVLSPNPASDFIEINNVIPAEAGILNQSIKIYNFLGKIVSGLDTPPCPLSRGGVTRIDVSGLATGVYFVRIGDSVQRFIKY